MRNSCSENMPWLGCNDLFWHAGFSSLVCIYIHHRRTLYRLLCQRWRTLVNGMRPKQVPSLGDHERSAGHFFMKSSPLCGDHKLFQLTNESQVTENRGMWHAVSLETFCRIVCGMFVRCPWDGVSGRIFVSTHPTVDHPKNVDVFLPLRPW